MKQPKKIECRMAGRCWDSLDTSDTVFVLVCLLFCFVLIQGFFKVPFVLAWSEVGEVTVRLRLAWAIVLGQLELNSQNLSQKNKSKTKH